MRNVLIGTGFYANKSNAKNAREFFEIWLRNTCRVSGNIRAVDNSEVGIDDLVETVRIGNNLGHVGDLALARRSQFQGWSLSWILTALVAYSEDCDFVYKEQDCLAFGDWLPEIRIARAAFGKHQMMPCEQSLFYIERDFIPTFVSAYLALPDPDFQDVPEAKFVRLMQHRPEEIKQFEMGVGRDRPIPGNMTERPWYAQKLTDYELGRLRQDGLI